MTRAPFIVIDGKLYRWKDILELRRAQLAAAGANWRSLRPCTTTAARPPSARHRGAICIQACSNIRPLKQGRAAHEGSAPARPCRWPSQLHAGAETAPWRGCSSLSLPLARRVRVEDFRGGTRFNRMRAYAPVVATTRRECG
jgi:hypothetical protein